MATKKKRTTPVTEDEASDLAEFIEGDDYEIGEPLPRDEWPTNRRAGRPSLTGNAARSPQVSFRLPPELLERAQRRAAAEGKTVSTLAREALHHLVVVNDPEDSEKRRAEIERELRESFRQQDADALRGQAASRARRRKHAG